MRRSIAPLTAALLLACAAPARAQLPKPLPRFVVDIRGFYSGFGQDPTTARDLSEGGPTVRAGDLPKRGLGGVAGFHVYFLRAKKLAIGIGGEGVLAKASAQRKDLQGEPVGDPIEQRIRGVAPQVSLNFGHKLGWSYVSAGMGPMAFWSYFGPTRPIDPPPMKSTIDLGAGARWFFKSHVAFCFDLRYYLTRPEEITGLYPGRQRLRLRVWSAGISIQ